MTKITDRQLNKWLDSYDVDTSTNRLMRLEERILERACTQLSPVFVSMGWSEKLIAVAGVCSVALLVLTLSQFTGSSDTYLLSSAYSYGLGGQ